MFKKSLFAASVAALSLSAGAAVAQDMKLKIQCP